MSEESERIKCLIIGSGPAGYTAAVYASRANLSPVLYSGIQPGGQLTMTTQVDNFPGFPEGVEGMNLMENMKKQAERLGTDIRDGLVTKADLSQRPFRIEIDKEKNLLADALIISTGSSARYLGLESEKKFRGQGVSACATCDGFFYRNRDVAVVGGGDTACGDALYLANICRKVYLVVRRDVLRASAAVRKQVLGNDKIEILWNSNVKEILGDASGVTGATIYNNKKNTSGNINIFGIFIAIGHHPNSEVFAPYLHTNEEGYIITDPGSQATNVPGVFAAGDVQDPSYRQAIVAAGSGCMAAMDAEKFLRGN
ncbi:MAG: thioredoxin-disulfide reductase [Bacteroidales bacterium]|jgi:thioredoxin reductase (NADPH)|nr:thioredoxin-disulfide reductase [Bacteroidales bacterium]